MPQTAPAAGYPASTPPREPAAVVTAEKADVGLLGGLFGAKRDAAPPAQATAPGAPPAPNAPPSTALAKTDPADEVARDPALVVYAASLVMAVYQVEPSLLTVERIAREHGGFVAKKQDKEIVIRVPRARFQEVVSGVDKVGDVIHRDVSALDVTEEHVDLEVRIKNARAMQARLKDLLQRANVKEAIEIEKELGRVTEELERLEGKLKVLRDRIAYSTISVSFQERAPSPAARSARLPFAWLGELGLPSLLSLTESK